MSHTGGNPTRLLTRDTHVHQRGRMPVKDHQPAPVSTAPNPTAEQDLIEALRRRDKKIYHTLVSRHTPLMLRLARQHVPSHAIAEEVVQDTWVAVLRASTPSRAVASSLPG